MALRTGLPMAPPTGQPATAEAGVEAAGDRWRHPTTTAPRARRQGLDGAGDGLAFASGGRRDRRSGRGGSPMKITAVAITKYCDGRSFADAVAGRQRRGREARRAARAARGGAAPAA
jgi:hypothetical protein